MMHHRFGGWFGYGYARHCGPRESGRPLGFFGGMMGRGGRGLHGFRAGRKMGADDLQLVILALLEEKPRHGYEIIKALDERSGGFYSPSPGMVYPALTYIEEIGHAAVESEGAKKLYRITDEGRRYLDERRAFAEAIFAQLRWIGSRMEHVRRAFEGDEHLASSESDVKSRRGFGKALNDARHALRAALISKFDADPEEQRRVAEILRRAADEIVRTKRTARSSDDEAPSSE
jgi:DNA-binding PadR family transcriptional regulator